MESAAEGVMDVKWQATRAATDVFRIIINGRSAANERHDHLCKNLTSTRTRISQTKKYVFGTH